MRSILGFGLLYLVACGEQGPQGEKGDQGEQGLQGETGENGTDGTNGVDGTDGQAGDAGQDGEDGSDALVSTVEEPAGDNCEDGGVAVSYGSDTNNNGELDEEEVTGVDYICNGTDGTNGAAGDDGELSLY